MKSRITSIKHPGIEQLERMAKLLDNQFTVPGTNFRFGLDPIIGFIPVAGGLMTFVVSALLAVTMSRYGGSGKLALMMLGNILIDAVVGAIPFLGRVFDFFFKANDRNINLLADHYRDGRHSGSGLWIVAIVLGGTALILFAVFWVLSQVVSGIFGLFS